MKNNNWFSAHKDGLRQIAERLVERRGFGIIGGELYQNVMDTSATACDIHLEMIDGRPAAQLYVQDNGPGYTDLTHAWTVFAPSEKKDDPSKAGRFNVGCKMALAFCRNAKIYTTSGTVQFDGEGRKEFPRRKRTVGTEVFAVIDCTRERFAQFVEYMNKLIVRPGLTLTINGTVIPQKKPIHQFEIPLQTEVGEQLKKTVRKTTVEIYEVAEGETAMLYELGIPIVETGDKYSVNVLQKVPLNIDRDNVTPAYLRDLRVSVFNEVHTFLNEDDVTSLWVEEATSNEKCSPEALISFKTKKYGNKSVAYDPTNEEANAFAVSSGYTLIPSRGLTKGQRDNLKRDGNIKTSSMEFPWVGKGAYSDSVDATPIDVIDDIDWTDGMKNIALYVKSLGWKLIGEQVHIRFVNWTKFQGATFAAAYGGNRLDFNVGVLGKSFFDKGINPRLNSLIIHELAHHYESNHLSEKYYDACCDLGAKLTQLAIEDRNFFKKFHHVYSVS